MTDTPRLIEHAFPLKQASLDSVHEKNVRHGHISTLHIWPARRPLAACRAALIATLLPDPSAEARPDGMSDDEWQKEILRRRKKLCEMIGGRVVRKMEKKKMPGGPTVEREKEQTEGGILRWLGEEPTSGGKSKREEWRARKKRYDADLAWFREEIRKAYGGRAPKVLDPFAGGGAIPLEAMRLGCEATAIDINPVAWFILKCTLEYPQKLAGQKRPLPAFILKDRAFMERFFESQGLSAGDIRQELEKIGLVKPLPPQTCRKAKKRKKDEAPSMFGTDASIEADLAWHVRAWGQWVLGHARKELAKFYPVYADFEPLDAGMKSYEHQPMRLVPLADDGTPDMTSLNGDFSADYLAGRGNPRWVAKPAVAYLWARTVTCKNCRATIPLLKTRWLCKKDNKRVLLTMEPNADKSGMVFGIETNVPAKGSNAAARREHDKRLGIATMSKAGAKCPCCNTIMMGEDIRLESLAGRAGSLLVTVVVDGANGKEYRVPTLAEIECAAVSQSQVDTSFSRLPFGLIRETISSNRPSPNTRGASGLPRYGINEWHKIYTQRQLLAISTFAAYIRESSSAISECGYTTDWQVSLVAYLCCALDRMIDFNSQICTWILGVEAIRNTFVRYALPVSLDFAEAAIVNDGRGGYSMCVEKVGQSLETIAQATSPLLYVPEVSNASAIQLGAEKKYDIICTDPPYYDAIPYSDIMDYFHVWLRRVVTGLLPSVDGVFARELGPKWSHDKGDGELIDDVSRFEGDRAKSKQNYEDGMAKTFVACWNALSDNGRLVIVFANKQANAWETLVAALIRSGFVVEGSWPIQTEQAARMQAIAGAALASSVWIVCKKRPVSARPGWDTKVLEEMRANIGRRLREFWDAGIRGPDFVWAATGPALEAYSKHPVVKRADEPGQVLSVSEFLSHARRMVVDFVVGRVLTGDEADAPALADRLDEPTAYYLLHRHDFGLDEAPAGACILYATACGLSDDALVRDWDLLVKTGGDDAAEEEDEESEDSDEPAEESGSGSKVKLKAWNHRRGRSLGIEAPGGRPVPLIDRIHRLMQLWKGGDVHKVDEYLDEHGLRRNELFRRVLQSLIELSKAGGDERSLLESLSNHVGAKGAKKKDAAPLFATADDDE